MELSPKQQTIELIKKSKRILIIGKKEVSGDVLGSSLALSSFLKELGKKPQVIISSAVPEIFRFLPNLGEIRSEYQSNNGKILRINTEKIPVNSMKWQKQEKFLDIILDTDKNLKFEFLEIINGEPKPDLIIVLGTPDVEKIDPVYDTNTEMFFEVPIINLDHHAGNEYFGTVNLVDLTATSVAEILVSLSEALGLKITDQDTATELLTGIIAETQSFRTQNTTPKSLTVAAQLLAAGARQQEIITNLYKKKPMALLKLWGDMLATLSLDKNYHVAWASVQNSDIPAGLTENDVFDAADELLSNTPDADIILILCETKPGMIVGKLKSKKDKSILEIARGFGGDGVPTNATFEITNTNLKDAELLALKKIHEAFAPLGAESERAIWDVIEKEPTQGETSQESPATPQVILREKKRLTDENPKTPREELRTPKAQPQEEKQPPREASAKSIESDPIEKALSSIENEPPTGTFSSLKDIIEQRKNDFREGDSPEEVDVFDEESTDAKELDI